MTLLATGAGMPSGAMEAVFFIVGVFFAVADVLVVLYLLSPWRIVRWIAYAPALVLLATFVGGGGWVEWMESLEWKSGASNWLWWVGLLTILSALWIAVAPLLRWPLQAWWDRRRRSDRDTAAPLPGIAPPDRPRRIQFTIRQLLLVSLLAGLACSFIATTSGLMHWLFLVIVVGAVVGQLAAMLTPWTGGRPPRAILAAFVGAIVVCSASELQLIPLVAMVKCLPYRVRQIHGEEDAIVALVGAILGVVAERFWSRRRTKDNRSGEAEGRTGTPTELH